MEARDCGMDDGGGPGEKRQWRQTGTERGVDGLESREPSLTLVQLHSFVAALKAVPEQLEKPLEELVEDKTHCAHAVRPMTPVTAKHASYSKRQGSTCEYDHPTIYPLAFPELLNK